MPSRRALLVSAASPWMGRAASSRDGRWKEWLDLASVPGAAVARLEGGKVAEMRFLGMRRAGEPSPVTGSTVFAAASLTKPLVAWVALQLADAGRLDLDRPIHDTLAFATSDRARRVTPRHVLSHSSGFPNWRFQPGQALECAFEPGSAFGYSGEGFYLLQELLEKVTGEPFLRLMRERALGPLGMKFSGLDRAEIPTAEFASGHTRRGEARRESASSPTGAPLPVNRSPNAAASLLTSLPDYARFALRAMTRTDWVEPRTRISSQLAWGLGWGVEEFRGERWMWHWGDNPGFKNLILCRPSRRDGVVIFTNGDNGRAVYERIVRDVLGHDHPILLWI